MQRHLYVVAEPQRTVLRPAKVVQLEARREARLEEARRTGFDREDFERIKSKSFGRFLRSFNSLEYVGTGYTEAYLQGWDFLRYLDILEPITLADIRRHLDTLFPEEGRALSIVRPA